MNDLSYTQLTLTALPTDAKQVEFIVSQQLADLSLVPALIVAAPAPI